MNHDTLTAIAAVLTAALGATAKGVWDWLSQKDQDSATVGVARIEDGAKIRDELWTEIDKLREGVAGVQADLDKVRREYIELLSEHTALKAEHQALKHEHDALQIRYAALEKRVNNV